jgi:Cu/Ag efflux protein CusF
MRPLPTAPAANPELEYRKRWGEGFIVNKAVKAKTNRGGGYAMKNTVISIVIGLGVAILSFSCAEQSSVFKSPPTGATVTERGKIVPANTEFEGTIGRIDPEGGFITVEHWPLSKTFKVTPDCQIDILTNASAVLAQLKTGDAVAVTYAEVGKDLVASRIARMGRAHDREEEQKRERLDDMLNPSPNQ